MISVLDRFLPVDLHRRMFFLFDVLARRCSLSIGSRLEVAVAFSW
jgi:hypothetical protein